MRRAVAARIAPYGADKKTPLLLQRADKEVFPGYGFCAAKSDADEVIYS